MAATGERCTLSDTWTARHARADHTGGKSVIALGETPGMGVLPVARTYNFHGWKEAEDSLECWPTNCLLEQLDHPTWMFMHSPSLLLNYILLWPQLFLYSFWYDTSACSETYALPDQNGFKNLRIKMKDQNTMRQLTVRIWWNHTVLDFQYHSDR